MGRFKQIGVSIGLFTGGLFAGVSLGRSKKSSSSTVAVATGISQQQQIAASKYHTKSPSDGPSDLIDSVGNTPLLEIKSLSKLTGCKIYAKAEFMNPSGSVKDRAAKYLILDAEDKGLIQRGQSIIEATGGNTGVALALLAASRGYKVVFTMPEKTSKEKVELMKLLGAEVHVQPGVTMFEDEHFYQLAQRLHKSISNSTYPNQV
jgi:cysteine synthase